MARSVISGEQHAVITNRIHWMSGIVAVAQDLNDVIGVLRVRHLVVEPSDSDLDRDGEPRLEDSLEISDVPDRGVRPAFRDLADAGNAIAREEDWQYFWMFV